MGGALLPLGEAHAPRGRPESAEDPGSPRQGQAKAFPFFLNLLLSHRRPLRPHTHFLAF